MKKRRVIMKKGNWKRMVTIVAAVDVALILIASLAGGPYPFDYAIVRKPPLSNEIASGGNED